MRKAAAGDLSPGNDGYAAELCEAATAAAARGDAATAARAGGLRAAEAAESCGAVRLI